jgi:hypothetical protein
VRAASFAVVLAFGLLVRDARADGPPADETATLFADGVRALKEERPNDAVASFEALADRGIIDPVVSYDRGLAYTLRVRAGAEQAGDLGRAAHGFEEARALSLDARLVSDADVALAAVRGEVGRRKAREGVTVDVEQHPSPWRTLARLTSENTWAWMAVGASFLLAAALFIRWLAHASRERAGAAIAVAVSAPLLVVAAALSRTSRHDRLWLNESVVISPAARPSDVHGIPLPQGQPLPEAARVEVVDQNAGFTEIRWGTLDAWVPASTLRPLAKP